MSVESASLYIHIPFCESKCDYCDFYSVTKKEDSLVDDYIKALIEDIKYQIEYFNIKNIPTVYIGGGTPSVLGSKISVLLETLNVIPYFSPEEFTIEANPESLTEDFLSLCRNGGITRLSLGVQTFHEPSRFAVNRGFTRIEDRIKLALKYFPDSLSVDLITGLPFQNEEIVIGDINKILEFNPAHVSLYSLTIEEGTPLEKRIKNKTVSLPACENADSLWLLGREALLNAGFHHYEVSNFAKEGKQCLHNIRYWQMLSWIGAGPAASGTIVDENTGEAKRYTYVSDIETYINKKNIVVEEICRNTLLKDSLLMGFRYIKGNDPQVFKKRFGCEVRDCIPQTLKKWEDKDKMLFLNQFISEAFIELDQSAFSS